MSHVNIGHLLVGLAAFCAPSCDTEPQLRQRKHQESGHDHCLGMHGGDGGSPALLSELLQKLQPYCRVHCSCAYRPRTNAAPIVHVKPYHDGANSWWEEASCGRKPGEERMQLLSPRHKAHAHQDTTRNKTRVVNTKYYLARRHPRSRTAWRSSIMKPCLKPPPRATSGGI